MSKGVIRNMVRSFFHYAISLHFLTILGDLIRYAPNQILSLYPPDMTGKYHPAPLSLEVDLAEKQYTATVSRSANHAVTKP